jgi:exosome complex RNA-binding protein Rrp42 (RNase PH superfamily)
LLIIDSTRKEEKVMENAIAVGHTRYSSEELSQQISGEESESATVQVVARGQKTKGWIHKEPKNVLSQLDRLLDPQNNAVSLVMLARAAALSGKRLVVEIRDQNPVKIIGTINRNRGI